MSNELIVIQAWGLDLLSIERDGHHWLALTPFCRQLGLEERGQRRRLVLDPLFSGCTLIYTLIVSRRSLDEQRTDSI